MKKWVWVVATIVVALLIGGYAYSNHHATAKEYQAAMANGRTAIQSKHYTQAESYFQNALKRRLNDKTAQRYLTQTRDSFRRKTLWMICILPVRKSIIKPFRTRRMGRKS
ncbi:hypothetical protein L3X07_02145 [Levilactobacillus brevis]|nr:hypothetical protein [Levilactobacillus brevis]